MRKPQVVDALKAILEKHPKKKLMPDQVVNAARSKASPLHRYFCWDDTKAAHEYRVWQARELIASVQIVFTEPARSGPAYVSLAIDRKSGGGYRDMPRVLSSAALKKEMLDTAIGELHVFQDRYHLLKELAGVFRETKRLDRKRKR